MNNSVTQRMVRLALPFSVLLLGSLFLWLIDGDLRLARAVHGPEGVWPGINRFPWNLLYDYGPLPAFGLAGLAGVVLLAGFFARRFAPCRKPALFLVLLLALGPGLVVNTLLKDHLGRARPIDVQEFGGDFPYTQFWQHGTSHENRSFPSGHAAVAFYLFAPWFVLRRRHRLHALCWLSGGLAYGLLVGAGRILQGGHFPSDILWAGGLVYLSGEILVQVMGLDREPADCWEQ